MDTLEKIKSLRKSNKYTQDFVAKYIGTYSSNYSRYESGEWKFTINHIRKLAELYGVSVSYLMDEGPSEDIIISKEDFDTLIKAKNAIQRIEDAMKK